MLQVILNGSKLPVKTFQDYVNLYLGPGTQRVYEKLGERWEVCISLAEQGQFQQVQHWHVMHACTLPLDANEFARLYFPNAHVQTESMTGILLP